MTTHTMLEKIARAIRKDWTGVEWGQPSEHPRMDHEDAFCVARTALQALREPTEEMVSASVHYFYPEQGPYNHEELRKSAIYAWQDAIDAILQEKA